MSTGFKAGGLEIIMAETELQLRAKNTIQGFTETWTLFQVFPIG